MVAKRPKAAEGADIVEGADVSEPGYGSCSGSSRAIRGLPGRHIQVPRDPADEITIGKIEHMMLTLTALLAANRSVSVHCLEAIRSYGAKKEP